MKPATKATAKKWLKRLVKVVLLVVLCVLVFHWGKAVDYDRGLTERPTVVALPAPESPVAINILNRAVAEEIKFVINGAVVEEIRNLRAENTRLKGALRGFERKCNELLAKDVPVKATATDVILPTAVPTSPTPAEQKLPTVTGDGIKIDVDGWVRNPPAENLSE